MWRMRWESIVVPPKSVVLKFKISNVLKWFMKFENIENGLSHVCFFPSVSPSCPRQEDQKRHEHPTFAFFCHGSYIPEYKLDPLHNVDFVSRKNKMFHYAYRNLQKFESMKPFIGNFCEQVNGLGIFFKTMWAELILQYFPHISYSLWNIATMNAPNEHLHQHSLCGKTPTPPKLEVESV